MTDQTPPAQRAAPLPVPFMDTLEPAQRQAIALGDVFARSGYFAGAQQQSQAAVRIMLGQAMGLAPVVAMAQVSVIDGRPSIGATAIAAMLRHAGYDFRVLRQDDDGCALRLWKVHRDGTREQLTSEPGDGALPDDVKFDRADAERADLLRKDNWRKYPRSMFFARAMTAAVRLHAPEVLGGLAAYDPDELRDGVVSGTAVEVPAPVEPEPPRTPVAPRDRRPWTDAAAIDAENAAKVAAQPTPPEPVQDPEPAPVETQPRNRRGAVEQLPDDEPQRVIELLGQGRDAIRDRAKSLGLSPSGTKLELARRIAAHEAETPGHAEPDAEPEPEPEPETVDGEVVEADDAKGKADDEREPDDVDCRSDAQLERSAAAGDDAARLEQARRQLDALGWRSVGLNLWAPPPGDDDRALTAEEMELLAAIDAEVAAPERVDDGAEREPSDDELAAAERLAAEHPDLAGMPAVDAEPAAGGTEPLVSVEQRRHLFAKFRECELHDEAAQRALIEWVTGEQITERLTAAKADEVLDVVPYWKMQLAQLARAASAGDERAQAIYARHLAPHEG